MYNKLRKVYNINYLSDYVQKTKTTKNRNKNNKKKVLN